MKWLSHLHQEGPVDDAKDDSVDLHEEKVKCASHDKDHKEAFIMRAVECLKEKKAKFDVVNNKVISHHNFHRFLHLVALAVINLCVYLAYTGVFSNAIHWLVGEHINTVNQAYLHTATAKTTELLEVLSESKVILALLQSSQGGIDFIVDVQVQLGQSLIVIFDIVNNAWMISFTALSSVEALKLLLDLSQFSMTPILTLFFISYGFYIGLRSRLPAISYVLLKLSKAMLFVVVLVHFILPLSVYSVAAAGHHFFSEPKKLIHESFAKIHSQLPSNDTKNGLKNQVRGGITHFKNHQNKLHKHTSKLSHLTAKHVIYVISEYIFLPILFIYALSIMLIKIFRRHRTIVGSEKANASHKR